MSTTPTAATPEELAAGIELVGTEAAQEEIRQDIAAAIRQHSDAQRAEIERLTDALDDVQTAYCNHVMQQPDANAIAQSVADYGSAEAAVKGLHDFQLRVHQTMIDHFKARATTAEAALSASLERELVMREALSKALDAADEVARAKGRLASVRGASDQKRRNMEEWVQRSTAALDAALSFARAALKQETANVR